MDTLTDAAVNFIRNLVRQYMSASRSFTSLDIANNTKDAGFFARNRHVAEWLRANAIVAAHDHGYLYNQTLIRVNSKAAGMTLAYLYHHMSVDVDSYLDRDQNPKSCSNQFGKGVLTHPQVSVVVQDTSISSPPKRSGNDSWMDQPRDRRGRFC